MDVFFSSRRRHTRYWRDWSSDVCSSDLDHAVDYDRYDVWNRGESPERVWAKYFEWLGEAARSGLFDVLAHPDLVKVWGRSEERRVGKECRSRWSPYH